MLNLSWNRWLDRLLARPVLVYAFMHACALSHLTWASKIPTAILSKIEPPELLVSCCISLTLEAGLTGYGIEERARACSNA